MITGEDNPACGLIHERHDFSRKVVMGCGSTGTKVEVWEVDSHLVYETAHACPGDDDADTTDEPGHFKELDNNYHDHEDFNTKYEHFQFITYPYVCTYNIYLTFLQSIGVH